MRPVRVTICGLLPKPDIGGFCSEGPLRAHVANSIFALHALAALALLQAHSIQYCGAAYRPTIHSNCSKDETLYDQVMNCAFRSDPDGLSLRQVAQSLSLGCATVSDYLRHAEQSPARK